MLHFFVKTLDSVNHECKMDETKTVQDLKNYLATLLKLSPLRLRLIFCGKVLQDDEYLSRCGINGKVIHLVNRPPPGEEEPPRSSSSRRQASSTRAAPTPSPSAQLGFAPNMVPNMVHNMASNIVPNMAPNMVPNMVPNMAPNMAPNAAPNQNQVPTTSVLENKIMFLSDLMKSLSTAICEIKTVYRDLLPGSVGFFAPTNGENIPFEEQQESNRWRTILGGPTVFDLNKLLNLFLFLQGDTTKILDTFTSIITRSISTPNGTMHSAQSYAGFVEKVLEVMHICSHIYHSFSEISMDMYTGPPRALLNRYNRVSYLGRAEGGTPEEPEASPAAQLLRSGPVLYRVDIEARRPGSTAEGGMQNASIVVARSMNPRIQLHDVMHLLHGTIPTSQEHTATSPQEVSIRQAIGIQQPQSNNAEAPTTFHLGPRVTLQQASIEVGISGVTGRRGRRATGRIEGQLRFDPFLRCDFPLRFCNQRTERTERPTRAQAPTPGPSGTRNTANEAGQRNLAEAMGSPMQDVEMAPMYFTPHVPDSSLFSPPMPDDLPEFSQHRPIPMPPSEQAIEAERSRASTSNSAGAKTSRRMSQTWTNTVTDDTIAEAPLTPATFSSSYEYDSPIKKMKLTKVPKEQSAEEIIADSIMKKI